jgi:protein-S-isoprenylcysteine O-methyltransferase Ste14
MYVAVVAVIVAQGLTLGNVRVLEYGSLVWLCFHMLVVVYEEPTLRATFGSEYDGFRSGVPPLDYTIGWLARPLGFRHHPNSTKDTACLGK